MKRRNLLLLIAALAIVAVFFLFWKQASKRGEAAGKEESGETTSPVTFLADQGPPPKAVTTNGTKGPPPEETGNNTPPSLLTFDNRRFMEALGDLLALPEEERLEKIAALLASAYSYERALGAIAAFEEGILTDGQIAEIAADPFYTVPLQLMGWIRDGLDFESGNALIEGFRERDDYDISALKVWARDRDTSAPAGRALLDLLTMEFTGEELEGELRQLAFNNLSRATNPDIRIEAGIRMAEQLDPFDFSREINQVRDRLPAVSTPSRDPSVAAGTTESSAYHRERARAYQEEIYAEQLDVLASRYNKPTEIIEAQGTPIGPAEYAAAWNLTGQWELDFLASLVEATVINEEPVQAGSVAVVEGILKDAAARNPTEALSNRQAYEARRIEAALPQLRALEQSSSLSLDLPPGATPPGG